LLDHDVFIKNEFLETLTTEFPSADVITAYFDDLKETRVFTRQDGIKQLAMPKLTPWHTILTRKMVDNLLTNPSAIFPSELHGDARINILKYYGVSHNLPIFFDTLSWFLHNCRVNNVSIAAISNQRFASFAQHFFGCSFNYGLTVMGEGLQHHLKRVVEIYEKEFPKGFRHWAVRRLLVNTG
jgi:hypothetical protein